MKNSRVRALSAIGLVVTDGVMIAVAFLIAYGIRWESAQADTKHQPGRACPLTWDC